MGKHIAGEPGGPALGRIAGLRVPLRAGAGYELGGWQLDAVASIADAARRFHSYSAENGARLVQWLRRDLPHADGLELASVLLTWLDFVGWLSEPPPPGKPWDPKVMLQALDEAAKMAVLELTKLEAPPGEG